MDDILVVEFTHDTFTRFPRILQELSEFYCNIWRYDPNFKEYKQCPVCGAYYSYEDWKDGVRNCANLSAHKRLEVLVDAWRAEDVAADLLRLVADPARFFGAVAVDSKSQSIIGFTWVRLMSTAEMQQHWKPPVSCALMRESCCDDFVYYNEIAVDQSFRGRGIASRLCAMACNWAKNNYPQYTTFLRTHANSPARGLFEKFGYTFFADDNEHGGGRIMMMVPTCADLV